MGVLKVEKAEDLERIYDESIAQMKTVIPRPANHHIPHLQLLRLPDVFLQTRVRLNEH